jgi:putative endonuclease
MSAVGTRDLATFPSDDIIAKHNPFLDSFGTGRRLSSLAGARRLLATFVPDGYNRRVHFVYIVRCADGTLYTGYARDPLARERVHNSGRGAKYTAGRRPVRLVYQEAFRSVRKALAREHVVKQLTRAQKNALVASGNGATSGAHLRRWLAFEIN